MRRYWRLTVAAVCGLCLAARAHGAWLYPETDGTTGALRPAALEARMAAAQAGGTNAFAQAQAYADQLAAQMTNYADGLLLDFAATGTVSRAGSATLLTQPDGMASAQLADGTAVVSQVSTDWTHLVVVEGFPFRGVAWLDQPFAPIAGTVFVVTNRYHAFYPDDYPYYESEDGEWALSGNIGTDSYWRWAHIADQPGWEEGTRTWWLGGFRDADESQLRTLTTPSTVAVALNAYVDVEGEPTPMQYDFRVAPQVHTNTYQFATQQGTVTLIGSHDADPDAHPAFARTNDLPGPGCTDISAGGVIAGATSAHWFSSATNYVLSVSESAPRYTYSIEVLSTNAATFAEGIELRGAWTPSGTNLVVIAPSTGTLWRAYGRAY